MSLARKILGNTFWQVFGRGFTAIIAFLTVGFLTNYWGAGNVELGQAKYGTYATIYEFLAIFGSIADLGIFTIAVREMAKHSEEKRKELFGATISLRVITLVLAMCAAMIAAYFIPQYQGTEIPKGVAIAAIGTGFFILSGTLSTVLLIHLQMRFHAVALAVGKILTFGVILSILFVSDPAPTTDSFYALIWAGVWGSVLTCLMTWYGARKFLPIRPNWNVQKMKELFAMALPFGIATLVSTIYFRLDITMMGILLPHSAADGSCTVDFCGDQQAGIYAVAVRILEVIIILPIYFMNSVLPSLSSSIAHGKRAEISRRLSFTFLFLLLIALPAATGLFLLAKPIVQLVTPADFGSDIALEILAFLLIIIFITTFLSYVLIAFGQQKKVLWINCFALILNFLLNFPVIPRYGFIGASYTSLISEAFILFAAIFFVLKYTRFSVEWRRVFGVLFSTIIMGSIVFFLWRFWGAEVGKKALAVVIPVAGFVYGTILLLTKTVDMQTLKSLLPGKKTVVLEP